MFDLIIKGGTIVDGTGSPRFLSDIGINGNKIAKIGNINVDNSSINSIDATGKIVSPGFIDTHGHSDILSWSMDNYDHKIRQGVTTEVIGCCGISVAPCNDENFVQLDRYIDAQKCGTTFEWRWKSFKDYLEFLSSKHFPSNIIPLVGHGTIRIAVMGFDERKPNKIELEKMKALVKEAMEAGAFGLSSGLVYPPGAFSNTDELIRLCEVVGEYGGLYATHMRSESDKLIEAIEEAIKIAESANTKLLVSHLKAMGKKNWGKVAIALDLLEKARSRGVEAWVDQYPYSAGSTTLNALVPPEEMGGGVLALINELKDGNKRKDIIGKIENENSTKWENFVYNAGGWEGVLISSAPNHANWEGKNLKEIAQENNKSAGDILCDLLIAENGGGQVVVFTTSEEDVKYIIKSKLQVVGSDGLPSNGKPHPRIYGTFPRFIGKYSREEGILTLEEATKKMTGNSSKIFNLKNRGIIKEGNIADLTIFDYNKINDTATYLQPHSYPVGIYYVILGGEISVKDGEVVNKELGKLLHLI
jgi:N-acyl-D-amino-acid deacylase